MTCLPIHFKKTMILTVSIAVWPSCSYIFSFETQGLTSRCIYWPDIQRHERQMTRELATNALRCFLPLVVLADTLGTYSESMFP